MADAIAFLRALHFALFCFIVESAMAEAFEFGISNLVAELLTHTDVFLDFFESAGAVPVLLFECFPKPCDGLAVGIEDNFHITLDNC